MADYPMHVKLDAVADKSQVIGDFIEWLRGKAIVLASYYEESGLQPNHVSIETLLAEFFEIDLEILEEEKRAMLKALRGANDV